MVEFLDVNGNKQSFDENGHFNIAFNADCMEFLRNCPDNAFDLCVCDPPYGISVQRQSLGQGTGIAPHTNTQRIIKSRMNDGYEEECNCND